MQRKIFLSFKIYLYFVLNSLFHSFSLVVVSICIGFKKKKKQNKLNKTNKQKYTQKKLQ